MRVSEGAQVEVVLGINTGGHVDVELQHLEELSLQFVPETVPVTRWHQCVGGPVGLVWFISVCLIRLELPVSLPPVWWVYMKLSGKFGLGKLEIGNRGL